jgi:hypothetical protein
MVTESTKTDIQQLWGASDSELLAVIGGLALPLVETPAGMLGIGRRGELYATGGDHLGTEFNHKGLEAIASRFFRLWRNQFKSAICGNDALGQEIRKRGLQERDMIIGAVIASLTAHIPELGTYSSLLTAIAIFIASSGVTSFCQLLDSL